MKIILLILFFYNCSSIIKKENDQLLDLVSNSINEVCNTADSILTIPIIKNEFTTMHIIQGGSIVSFDTKKLDTTIQYGFPIILAVSNNSESNYKEYFLKSSPCTFNIKPAFGNSGSIIRFTKIITKEEELLEAIKSGNLTKLKEAIKKGADINTNKPIYPIFLALFQKKFDIAKYLLSNGANVKIIEPEFNQTPLHYSAAIGNLEITETILNKGANLEAVDTKEYTALWMASFHNHPKIMDFLLKKKADLNRRDSKGNRILTTAAANGAIDSINYLLKKGVDINDKNLYSRTAIFDAIDNNKFEAVKLLIDKGANVNIITQSGNTPLKAALNLGNKEIIQLLKNSGAN